MEDKEKLNKTKLKRTDLPSIKQLFLDSWILFRETWVTYLKIIGLIIVFVVLGALIGILIALPVSFAVVGSHFQVFRHFTPFHIITIVLFILWFLAYFLSFFVIGIVFPILSIFILQKKKGSVTDLLKQTKFFFWPYFLLTMLSTVLTIGGLILLVVPGLVIGLLFGFVGYEVVIEKQKGITALKRSYFMIKNYFWEFVGRILLLQLCIVIISSLLGNMMRLSGIGGLLQLVFTLLSSWYARSYVFLLYQQIRERTTFPDTISLKWVWVISLIGWVLLLSLMVALIVNMPHLPGTTPELMHKVAKSR